MLLVLFCSLENVYNNVSYTITEQTFCGTTLLNS